MRTPKIVKSVFLSLVTAAAVVAQSSWAKSWNWHPPHDRGFAIEATTAQGVAHDVGDHVKFEGSVLWMHSNSKGYKAAPKDILNDLEVEFFFPDFTTNVTDQVTFDKNKLNFSFTTDALVSDSNNTLHVVVGRPTDKTKQLQKISSKIERRITALLPYVNTDPVAKALVDRLRVFVARINETTSSRFETLAKLDYPLQVANKVAAPAVHESLISGFLIRLTTMPGVAVEGDRLHAKAVVTNYRKPLELHEDDGGDEDDRRWVFNVSWAGAIKKQFEPQKLKAGESIAYEFDVENLPAGSSNELEATIFKYSDDGDLKRYGTLSYIVPVAQDQVAPVLSVSSPLAAQGYFKTMPLVSALLTDEFGRVSSSKVEARLTGATDSGAAINLDAKSFIQFVSSDFDSKLAITGDLNPLLEGQYQFRVSATDLAGNTAVGSPSLSEFRIDRSAPIVTLGLQDHILTRVSAFVLPVTISDRSPATTTVTHNGATVYQGEEPILNVAVALSEGLNVFEVSAVDAAGNASETQRLIDVVLDSTPPVLSNLRPLQNQILNTLGIALSGSSNEPLSAVSVNGQDLTLSGDKRSFTGMYVAQVEGALVLEWQATDLAGNSTSHETSVQISLKVLNGDLLSVVPDPKGTYFLLKGAPGATRPGLTVKASAGFFNNESAVGGVDGSFVIKLLPFSRATVSATDPSQSRTETAEVTFGLNTLLSGTVKDTAGHALAGVTVRIEGTSLVALTDGSGVFTFAEPVLGDQILVVDGSTVPPVPNGVLKKFSVVKIALSIGLNQSNVIERPIYLAPTILDGTETVITAGSAAVVSSPHAPGVELNIPAGVTQFPGTGSSGSISVATISSQFSTIAPLNISVPDKVVAFEPSGVEFSERVQLTLPNDNELPPQTDLVIMSMNSKKGIWEVDGIARVTSDGRSIVTKPGLGIKHFSILYASPLGPKILQAGRQDKPGTDIFNGALSTTVSLPSYKSLGQSIVPSLLYRSSWARPSVLMTNIFDLPRQEVDVEDGFEGNFGNNGDKIVIRELVHGWVEPNYITVQMTTHGITTDVATFTGLPNQSVVSFATELKDPVSNDFLSSNVYPYFSHWEVRLKAMLMRTRRVAVWSEHHGGQTVIAQDSWPETRLLEKFFPSDFQGLVSVQNQVNSSAGSGWRIGGVQRIPNPGSNRVIVEEADGGLSNYAINNTITTLFNANSTGVNLSQGVDLLNFPKVMVTKPHTAAEIDLSMPNASAVDTLSLRPKYDAKIASWDCAGGGFGAGFWYCDARLYSVSVERNIGQIIRLADGKIFLTETAASQIHSSSNNGPLNLYVGRAFSPSTYVTGPIDGRPMPGYVFPSNNLCNNREFLLNSGDGSILFNLARVQAENVCAAYGGCNLISQGGNNGQGQCMPNPDANAVCNQVPFLKCSEGALPVAGASNDGAIAGMEVNRPIGIIPGPRANTLLVADTGNNRVRLIDLTAGTSVTIAGNGQTFDSGDGGLATQASLFHPRGLAYDSVGNLYISTENGYIRKVDLTGRISTFAGMRFADGGTVGENIHADRILLQRPTGLVVDNIGGYLYVADTGAHIVRRIDLLTQNVISVAGNGTPGFNGDNKAALDATLSNPTWLGLDDDQNLIVVDSGNARIRRVIFQNTSGSPIAYVSTNEDRTSLTQNSDGTWTRRYKDGIEVYFNSAGLQTGSLDRVGRQTAATYDGLHRLLALTDSGGRTTQYGYSGDKLSSITDPAARTTTFSYSGDYLIGVNYPDGTGQTFEYNAKGLLSAEVNERGTRTEYTYNEWNRLSNVKRADGKLITINDSGSATAANNYTGGTVGQLKKYGADQVYDGIIDVRSVETKYVKDINGQLTKIVDADGLETQIIHDSKGRVSKVVRPDGTYLEYAYDSLTDELLSQTDSALGVMTRQTYDAQGNVITKTNGRGFTSRTEYHPTTGLVLREIDALNQAVTYQYGALGLVTSVTNPLGNSIVSTFDTFGNVASMTDSTGKSVNTTRDLAGNVISKQNANGQITRYEYDIWNRLTAVTTPKNERTEYTYFPTGEMAQIKDALGNITTFEYDTLGRLIKKTDPLGFATLRSYDDTGRLAQEIDPNNTIKTFTYNDLDQLVQKNLPDNIVRYAYDVRGYTTDVSNNTSTVNYTRDIAGRITSTRNRGLGVLASLPDTTLAFTYDKNANRRSLSGPMGTISYDFDELDRMTSITNFKGELFSYSYDAASRQTVATRPGGQTTFAFDDRNVLTSMTHTSSGITIASFAYVMDNIGNRVRKTTQAGHFDFEYDLNNQVTRASNPETTGGFNAETFNYDSIYNRSNDQDGVYSYDAKSQRLVEDYRNFYFYDNNGNLLSKQAKGMTGEVTNYSYSSENQLLTIKVFEAGNTSPVKEVFYTYNVLGHRVQKQVIDYRAPADVTKTFVRRYVYDGSEMLIEYDGSNNVLARYTYSGMRPDDILASDITTSGVSQKLAKASGSYFYVKDGLGSVTDITNSSGTKIQHYLYSVFGVLLGIHDANSADITNDPNLATSFTFTGRELDLESGFYYYRARYYDPYTGRFLQKDPEPGKLNIPATVTNSYIYAINNPTRFTDPTGRIFFLAGFAVAMALTSTVVTSAIVAGAIIGAMASLAAIEAMRYNFDTSKMVQQEGWDLVGVAAIGAATGAVGGWAGQSFGNFAFGSAVGQTLGQKMAIGAVANATASSLNTGGLIEAGYIKGDATDVGMAFLLGAGLGGVTGAAHHYFYPNLAIPAVIVSETGAFIYTNQPIEAQ